MKPILFEQGNNDIFRVSVNDFPLVAGTGPTMDEAIKNFFDAYEKWNRQDHAGFKRWYLHYQQAMEDWAKNDVVDFVKVDRAF